MTLVFVDAIISNLKLGMTRLVCFCVKKVELTPLFFEELNVEGSYYLQLMTTGSSWSSVKDLVSISKG